MRRILHSLDPIKRLGKRNYSILLPLLVSLSICILSEIFAISIMKNPNVVGVYIIWVNIVNIIYFAFRDGLRGGIIAAVIPIVYYLYIIYTRNHAGQQLVQSLETTFILTLLFLVIGGVIGWLKQKIDSLIESESDEKHRLYAIIEQMPVGVVITDKKGKVERYNKKLESILGTKIPQGFTIGSEPVLPTKAKGKAIVPSKGPLAQVIASGAAVVGKEFTITRKDGKTVYILTSAAPIHNAQGKLTAAVSISNDITAQKELENRKDDFVNMASHELKTPITSMKLYIDSLASRVRQYNDERADKTINSIKHQTERLQELVNDLLDVSRIQTGKLSFTKEAFRIDELVAESVEDVQGMAKGQNVVLRSKAPVNVFADRFRIYQVLTNLLTNAIKYSPNGKDIFVKVKRQEGKAIISVQDFGIGIAREQQKRIFDRLYQVVDDKEKTFPGFGMGLYISREIIKRHRGSIWVESEGKSSDIPASKQGSTFYFTLPLKK